MHLPKIRDQQYQSLQGQIDTATLAIYHRRKCPIRVATRTKHTPADLERIYRLIPTNTPHTLIHITPTLEDYTTPMGREEYVSPKHTTMNHSSKEHQALDFASASSATRRPLSHLAVKCPYLPACILATSALVIPTSSIPIQISSQ